MSTFFLLVRDGGREPAQRIEARAGLEIGRSPDVQCVLTDPNVGRKAAKLVEERGALYVEDLGSTNRTSIRGGRKLSKGERERLRHGLVVEVGKSSIEVEEQKSPPSDATDVADATLAGGEDPLGEQTLVASAPQDFRPPPPAARAKPPPARSAAPPAPAKRPEPAVQPPPAVKPAPLPAAPARPAPASPVSSSTADFMGPGGAGSGTQSIRPVSGELGAIGALMTRRPRLVIVNEADRRSVPLERMVTQIGRESGECRIDHMAISQPHATIKFVAATNNFQIEDQQSKNQTFVGGLALNPGQPQLLAPECLVRFGPIEAVFVVDRDSENAEIPATQYAAAVRWLLAQKLVTPAQVKSAQEEAQPGGKHVGEVLMLAGVVNARTWTKAFATGSSDVAAARAPSGRKAWVLAAVVLLVLAALAWAFRAKLGF